MLFLFYLGSPYYVKWYAHTNSQANKLLNSNSRKEKKENSARSAKKRDIASVEEMSPGNRPKRAKRNVLKITNKSHYHRIARNTVKLRIKVSNYSPLKYYKHKLPIIPEEQ